MDYGEKENMQRRSLGGDVAARKNYILRERLIGS
jgi:hypothetical protein